MLRSSIDTPRTFTKALCCPPRLARILDERPPAMMSAVAIIGGVTLDLKVPVPPKRTSSCPLDPNPKGLLA